MSNSIRSVLIAMACVAISLSSCQQGNQSSEVGQESKASVPSAVTEQLSTQPPSNQPSEQATTADQAATSKPRGAPDAASTALPITSLVEKSPPTPPKFRRPDVRQPHDDARLAAVGISLFESKRFKLYTDIDAEIARTLPPLVDQAFDAWEQVLGPLLPDEAGTDFQITGYLIRDMSLFRAEGLVPNELAIEHGRQVGYEFWMRDQPFDYFREHLLIHEATHCFMTAADDVELPVWYLEGMAEYFGLHTIDSQGRAKFGVVPTSAKDFAGFRRIQLIHDDVVANRALSISSILEFHPLEFRTLKHYAWSWALCLFLDKSPKYRDRFRQLPRDGDHISFNQRFLETFQQNQPDLTTEWSLFTAGLQYGYDFERATIEFHSGEPLSKGQQHTVRIDADRGWQSSKVLLERGQTYTINATGDFTLADQPKPWLSEPDGISFRYFGGRPIGMLLGCIREEASPTTPPSESMLSIIPIGRTLTFKPDVSGTLYLRINDAWNSLADNKGHTEVTVKPNDR